MYKILGIFFVALTFGACTEHELPSLNYELQQASVISKGTRLVVSTGKVERTWELTNFGLSTVSFKDLSSGTDLTNRENALPSDWEYFGLIDGTTPGRLIHLTAKTSDDEGFTSPHIEICAEFEYPSVESSIKYLIWVYPNAPGIRTQLFIRGDAEKYITNTSLKAREDLVFDVVKGKNKNNYAAGEFAERHITTTVQDEQSVQLHVKGLDAKNQYKLGFTWWNFSESPSVQDVRITSVDGETTHKVVAANTLPNFPQKQELFETVVVNLPSETLLDGTCRIFFDKIEGNKAQVSELFIFEKGERKLKMTNGLPERIQDLRANQPDKHSLIAYLDCGEAILAITMTHSTVISQEH